MRSFDPVEQCRLLDDIPSYRKTGALPVDVSTSYQETLKTLANTDLNVTFRHFRCTTSTDKDGTSRLRLFDEINGNSLNMIPSKILSESIGQAEKLSYIDLLTRLADRPDSRVDLMTLVKKANEEQYQAYLSEEYKGIEAELELESSDRSTSLCLYANKDTLLKRIRLSSDQTLPFLAICSSARVSLSELLWTLPPAVATDLEKITWTIGENAGMRALRTLLQRHIIGRDRSQGGGGYEGNSASTVSMIPATTAPLLCV